MTQPPISLARLARKHRIRVSEMRLLTTGKLDDPAFVDVVRRAAGTPRWELVETDALWWLLQQSLRLETLGGSLDDLFTLLLQNIEVLQQPCNANYAKTHSVRDVVELIIDAMGELQHDADLAHGRRMRKVNPATARAERTRKAALRAARAAAQVDARPSHLTKSAEYRRLASAEEKKVSGEAIRKRIERSKRKAGHSDSPSESGSGPMSFGVFSCGQPLGGPQNVEPVTPRPTHATRSRRHLAGKRPHA